MPEMTNYIRHLILAVLLLQNLAAAAQPDDTQLRQNLGIRWRINKKWTTTADFRFDLNQNLGAFRRSNFTLGASYEVTKWLEASLSYRFGTGFNRDFHRFRAALSTEQKIAGDLSGSFRTMVQHDVRYLDADYLRNYRPNWIWRNRLQLRYALSQKARINAYTDLFSSYRSAVLTPYRLRSGLSASYLFKRRHTFEAGYFYQNEFGIENPGTMQAFELGYTFDVVKKKKKKKKKSPGSE